LRARSAAATAALGFPGFGIGGLSVGEAPAERDQAIDAVIPELPERAPRYVMGLGDTEGILAAVARGVDLFDCVLPTRVARHGKVLSRTGDFSIKRAEWTQDPSSIDDGCTCLACVCYSRGYIRHLFSTRELLGLRLLSIHNLTYTLELMRRSREAIDGNRFDQFRDEVVLLRSR
jgi:queuine tRNA-ribosyltransferase